MDDVCVVGVGMHRFGVLRQTPAATLVREAGRAALADAGISFRDVGAAWVGHLYAPPMMAVYWMKEFGLTGLPITRVENASATGSVAFREAYLAVATGQVIMAVSGSDTIGDASTSSTVTRRSGWRCESGFSAPWFQFLAAMRARCSGLVPRSCMRRVAHSAK